MSFDLLLQTSIYCFSCRIELNKPRRCLMAVCKECSARLTREANEMSERARTDADKEIEKLNSFLITKEPDLQKEVSNLRYVVVVFAVTIFLLTGMVFFQAHENMRLRDQLPKEKISK